MKRKKQIGICFLSVVLLCFVHIRVQDLYFSPEAVYDAYEKGYHREPYKGIVLEYETETGKMLVGLQSDGLLFAPVEQRGVFWTLRENGTHGLWKSTGTIDGIFVDCIYYAGICKDAEITEVTCVYGQWEEGGSWKLRKSSGRTDENGVFFLEVDMLENEPYVHFVEGRNQDGEVIYTAGFDDALIRDAQAGNVIWLDEG